MVELGARADERLARAVARLFTHPALEGPYPAREREPAQQQRASPRAVVADGGSVFGIGALPDEKRVPVGAWAFRASPGSDGSRDREGTDWHTVYVPLGSLSLLWPEVGPYPFLDSDEEAPAHRGWQERIEDWFVDIARHLHAGVPFRLAVVGHDVDMTDEECRRWWSWEPGQVPSERWDGILLPESPNVLAWHPPTRRGGWVLDQTPGNPSTWAEIFGSGSA